jgi:hypothetical protein
MRKTLPTAQGTSNDVSLAFINLLCLLVSPLSLIIPSIWSGVALPFSHHFVVVSVPTPQWLLGMLLWFCECRCHHPGVVSLL